MIIPQRIGLTGLPRCGKDSFAARLMSQYGFARLAFATPLKEAAAILLGRTAAEMNGYDGFDREAILPEWGFSTRWFLQRFGTECLRDQIRQDFWTRKMANQIDAHAGRSIVITDCRFPNEAAVLRARGFTIVEITRPGYVSNGHISDAPVPHDVTIANTGTLADLWGAVDAFVSGCEIG